MADWTTLLDDQLDASSPITDDVTFALRDNPIAIAEGAVGAPSMLAGIAARTTAGGLGTYVFATPVSPSTTHTFGQSVAGSGLRPAQALLSTSGSGDIDLSISGTALSGTWRCMGYYAYSGVTTHLSATLYTRIA